MTIVRAHSKAPPQPEPPANQDLDENTQVLTGHETFVETSPADSTPLSGQHGGLAAFRVALAHRPGGGLDARILGHGEAAPPGQVVALVVALESSSSAALSELLSHAHGSSAPQGMGAHSSGTHETRRKK